jgi:hypothetical protein
MDEKPQTRVVFMDDPHAPELYADVVSGFFLHNGNISLTFDAARYDHSNAGAVNRVVTARIVLPIRGAQGLALSLFDFLKKQGLDPTKAATDGDTMQ